MAASKLAKYQEMRDFSQTAEPSGKDAKVVASASACASSSRSMPPATCTSTCGWNTTGPSAPGLCRRGHRSIPKDRRMAMEVEDHPLDYGDFEGTIPKGQYGGGTVMLWDRGYWAPERGFEKIAAALSQGRAEVRHGGRADARLLGAGPHQARQPGQGQLAPDQASRRGSGRRATQAGPTDEDQSVASGRTMVEIANR